MGNPKNPQDRVRLLVVEDDSGTRTSLIRLLQQEGFEAYAFGNGDPALEWVMKNGSPGAVILDMILAGTDLHSFVRELRGAISASVPIIAVSASPLGRQTADTIGCFKFVEKPFNIEELLDVLHRAIAR